MPDEREGARIAYARWICDTKRAFDDRAAAEKMARKRILADESLTALYAYRCPACRRLHMTKKKVGVALVVRAKPSI